MESNFYSDEFEQLIREKTEQYKMYPSEKSWKGIYSSLHTKKRWFIAGMSVLVTGIIVIAGKELITPQGHAGTPKKSTLASTVSNNRSTQESPVLPVAFSEYKPGSHSSLDHNGQGSGLFEDDPALDQVRRLSIVDPVTGQSEPDPDAIGSEEVDGPAAFATRVPPGQINGQVAGPAVHSMNVPSAVPGNKPVEAFGKYLSRLRMGIAGKDGLANVDISLVPDLFPGTNPAPGLQIPLHQSNYTRSLVRAHAAEEAENAVAADAVAVIVDTVASPQRVNWLQDYAVYNLTPASHRSGDVLEFYVAPTASFRTLSGGAYQNPKTTNSSSAPAPPTPMPGRAMTIADYKVNTPAPGFAAGADLVHKVGRNLSLKVGLQFNYSRYTLKAYGTNPTTTVAGPSSDSAASVNMMGTSGGQQVQFLHNEYYEISAPIGVQVRILGNDRLQLNVAATVQPSYLLNSNSYLLTTDYSHYTTDPGSFRKWNLNGGIEAFVSYKINKNISLLAGPEFRYQFFSTYSNQYPIRENLQQYGLKIGFTKALR